MAKVITIINNKGGVGKTTIACHLAFAAGEAKKKVMLGDLDTQGNAGQFLSKDLEINTRRGGAEQLFGSGELKFTPAWVDNIQLLHGHHYLEELDKQGDALNKISISKRASVRKLPFDYLIFDTPPALGPRQVAPLFWSDIALIVVEPQLTALLGLQTVYTLVDKIRRVNPGLTVKLVINRFTKSSSSQKGVRAKMEDKYGPQLVGEFALRVPVSDALANFLPVWKFSKDKKLNAEWKSFANRVLEL